MTAQEMTIKEIKSEIKSIANSLNKNEHSESFGFKYLRELKSELKIKENKR